MKNCILLIVFCLSCFVAAGAELSEKELKKLAKSVKISSVVDETIKGDDREKIEVVKIYTYQNRKDPNVNFNYRIRVAVELTDREKNAYFARVERKQGSTHDDYIGKDEWGIQIPHGGLERPKVTAYAIQYGILNEGEFVVLAEDYDDVDTLEELMDRTTTRLEEVKDIQHWFWFTDRDGKEERSFAN